jgi:hypothetical protein
VSLAERIDGAQPLRAVETAPLTITPTAYTWRDPATIPKREFLYGYELQRKHVSAVIAPGAAGKTTYKVGRALALVTGKPLLGKPIHHGPKRVWLWNHEDNMEEQTRSIQAACQHFGLAAADIGDRLFVDSAMDGAIMKLAKPNPLGGGVTIDEAMAEALTQALLAAKVDYLDLDPFVSIHGVDENDNMAIDAIVKLLGRVATAADCAVCLAHHVAKARSQEVDSNSARGAVALTAACRSVLTLNRMNKEQAEGWNIIGEENRRYFRVYDDKNNRAPPADDSEWFKIESVSLSNGDNLGVVTPWNPPDVFEGVTTEHLVRVQEMVAQRSKEEGGVRHDIRAQRWVGKLIIDALGGKRDDKADKQRAKKIFGAWLANGAFQIEEAKDSKGTDREFVVVGRHVEPGSYTPRPQQST